MAVGCKPLHGFLESFPERTFRLKAKELLGPTDIQTPSRLSVGLSGIPGDLSCKTGFCGNHSPSREETLPDTIRPARQSH